MTSVQLLIALLVVAIAVCSGQAFQTQVANQDVRPTRIDRSKLTLVGYVCPPCP